MKKQKLTAPMRALLQAIADSDGMAYHDRVSGSRGRFPVVRGADGRIDQSHRETTLRALVDRRLVEYGDHGFFTLRVPLLISEAGRAELENAK